MKKLLVINSSARDHNSQSRKLTELFVNYWKSVQTDPFICFRDLGNANVPHINQNWISAAFKPTTMRNAEEIEILKTSDLYISELREADIIVLGSPMYNWSIPSTLKAYIDQILRVNETWKINPADKDHPYLGLLENKTLFLFLTRGARGYEEGGANEHMDFQTDYLKTIFKIIGITNIHVIAIDGASFDGEKFKESVDSSQEGIKALIERELL